MVQIITEKQPSKSKTSLFFYGRTSFGDGKHGSHNVMHEDKKSSEVAFDRRSLDLPAKLAERDASNSTASNKSYKTSNLSAQKDLAE